MLNCTLFSCTWIAFWFQTPQWGLTALPHTLLLLKLLSKSSRITSEKIIRTLELYAKCLWSAAHSDILLFLTEDMHGSQKLTEHQKFFYQQ